MKTQKQKYNTKTPKEIMTKRKKANKQTDQKTKLLYLIKHLNNS